jgi:hypothetical protein
MATTVISFLCTHQLSQRVITAHPPTRYWSALLILLVVSQIFQIIAIFEFVLCNFLDHLLATNQKTTPENYQNPKRKNDYPFSPSSPLRRIVPTTTTPTVSDSETGALAPADSPEKRRSAHAQAQKIPASMMMTSTQVEIFFRIAFPIAYASTVAAILSYAKSNS